MRPPLKQPPVWLLPLLLSTSGWAAPLLRDRSAKSFIPIGNSVGDAEQESLVTLGRCAAKERLLHVENLTIVKSPTTTLTGTLEIHIDPRFAVSCVLARPKTPSSRAALHGYRFLRPSCIEIHVQEQQELPFGRTDESSLDYRLLVYGVPA
ncbi:uncharacterized protein LOC126572747 [Anopheles aquasalis]|nr:uncharacterized protein LOC126572747 [Anopheles aquasalis]